MFILLNLIYFQRLKKHILDLNVFSNTYKDLYRQNPMFNSDRFFTV